MRIQQPTRAVLAVVCGFWIPHFAWAQPATPSVDFKGQIQPILETHCHRCHGPSMRSGGVRLDRRDDVIAKGYSQSPLVGGTLQTNEIYRRVASKDVAYRMPKGEPPLSDQQIGLIRQWVEAGAQWPEDSAVLAKSAAESWFSQEAWLMYGERWVNEVPGFIPWLCVMLVLQLGLLMVERYKQAVRSARPWTDGPRARWLRPFRHFNVWHFVLIDLLMAVVLLLEVQAGLQAKTRQLEQTVVQLNQAIVPPGPPTTLSIYGNPPIPIRPNHPPRLSGTYYRGNCERNEKLFNGGNYRTATLRVSLIDAQGHEVKYGDRVAANSLAIRFELERALGTTDALYGESISKGVFLTRQPLTEKFAKITEPIASVRVIKPGWKWEAVVPLKGPSDEYVSIMSGMIYMYQGTVEQERARGTVHYGIKYDLHLNKLAMEPNSEVWVGNLFWTPTLEHPHRGQVPLKQWFDYEPIPEVTGPNSTDPKLLGIPQK